MGRVIRRVPLDWEHPQDGNGEHIPLLDYTLADSVAQWQRDGSPPDEDPRKYADAHRPPYTSDASGYQVYEDVTEGTPISPVFATREQMRDWLLAEGYSKRAVDRFMMVGWAPSFVMRDGRISDFGISSFDAGAE